MIRLLLCALLLPVAAFAQEATGSATVNLRASGFASGQADVGTSVLESSASDMSRCFDPAVRSGDDSVFGPSHQFQVTVDEKGNVTGATAVRPSNQELSTCLAGRMGTLKFGGQKQASTTLTVQVSGLAPTSTETRGTTPATRGTTSSVQAAPAAAHAADQVQGPIQQSPMNKGDAKAGAKKAKKTRK